MADTVPDHQQLRAMIEEELKKPQPDWRTIEAVSRGVVDQDPDSVRFSVDAAHIQRLGEQLVSKQETALSELIKNAYDADATNVSLSFSSHEKTGGSLVISDNGNGMSEEVVRTSWMTISTNTKEAQPLSPVFGRVRAGRKGIGRFSVQRLGKKLTFITRPAGSSTGLMVVFDWDSNFRSGISLNDVFSSIERFEKEPHEQGTDLRIEDLRDAWTKADIEKVWRAVILLQPPFPVSTPATVDADTLDPGFSVTINDVTKEDQAELFSIEKSFLSQAVATITASVDAQGKATVRLVSDKLQLDETESHQNLFLLTGQVELDTRYFIYESGLLSGMTQGLASKMGRQFGGVRIYRNGFRVQPYGDPSDDWLSLAFDSGRRNLLIPANYYNFFGQVAIPPAVDSLFEETSSREGLIENEAFTELRDFVRWAVEWAATRVASARKRKTHAGEAGFVSIARKPSEVLREVRENRGSGSGSTNSDFDEDFAKVEEAVVAFERNVEEERAAAIEYEEMLRILASLGLSISVFGHEVKGAQTALSANIIVLGNSIGKVSDPTLHDPMARHHRELRAAAERVFNIGGYIAGLMSRTESREMKQLSIKGAIDRFVSQFRNYMAKQDVHFEVEVFPPSLRTAPMHSAEFDSVLLNFLTNSIKSMKRAKVQPKKVRISARQEGRHVVVSFEDNGIGIPEEARTKIFDPFFTTTVGAEDDGVAGPGTGLGLKIVSDIAESYGGRVEISEASSGYKTKIDFRVLSV